MSSGTTKDGSNEPLQSRGIRHVLDELSAAIDGQRSDAVGERSFGSVVSRVYQALVEVRQVFAVAFPVEGEMTPDRLKSIREELGLSQAALAELLRLGTYGKRTVARWEAGDVPVPGPVSVALEALESGWRPGDGKWRELHAAFLAVLNVIEDAVAQARQKVRPGATDDPERRE